MIEVKNLIFNIENYDAHILQDNKGKVIKREPLEEHIKLTTKYFIFLWREKYVDEIVERFCDGISKEISVDGKMFIQELIFSIPVFHDFGKINSKFQLDTMKNKKIKKNPIFEIVGSKHSLISSILYIDYFMDKVNDMKNREQKKILRYLILLNAYVIERHHSDLKSIEDFFHSLKYGIGEELIKEFLKKKDEIYQKEFSLKKEQINAILDITTRKLTKEFSRKQNILIYTYVRLMYSLLIAADFYATSEFMSGKGIVQVGSLDEIEKWIHIYEKTDVMQSIRKYERESYPQKEWIMEKEINNLRTELFLDVEQSWKQKREKSIYYLEAPTGSGKSNLAMNLSFQMLQSDSRLKKIYYIYPFNTLVEQNKRNLEKVFGEYEDIWKDIAVVNSLTSIKIDKNRGIERQIDKKGKTSLKEIEREKEREENSEQTMYYQKALLDRQFLNYPMVLSTHVSLFDIMFGHCKESAFGFHQLANSVIVLDEIQSYKLDIWAEIICFLKEFADLLNMKVIIMSATLPNLNLLLEEALPAVNLIEDREKYFLHPCFKNRVKVSYELLDEKENKEEQLFSHVKTSFLEGKKILIEFIKKDSAFRFYQQLKMDEDLEVSEEDIQHIEYMSGDDSILERSRILNKIDKIEGAFILVATQVVEAGVDISMDIGYKDISKLDSEEQFFGRINRSCTREGDVYLFDLDEPKKIYKNDIRVENKRLTLYNEEMRRILSDKDFSEYYEEVMQILKKIRNESTGQEGLELFFANIVRNLKFLEIEDRMRLIQEDEWNISVYLSRNLRDENGEELNGKEIWEKYVELLKDFSMGYAEKRVKLSEIMSKMNYFIYQVRKDADICYNDRVGDLLFIEEGEKYFTEGKIDRKKMQGDHIVFM